MTNESTIGITTVRLTIQEINGNLYCSWPCVT
jgi:hypothetical protein